MSVSPSLFLSVSSVCLFVLPSVLQSVCPSIFVPSVCPFYCRSVLPTVCPFFCLSVVCLSFRLSVPSVDLSVIPSVLFLRIMFICLSAHTSFCVCLTVLPVPFVCLIFHLYVFPSLCMSVLFPSVCSSVCVLTLVRLCLPPFHLAG